MKPPEMIVVESARIQSIGHKDDALFIRFAGGAMWKYADVPKETFLEGLASPSIGRWFGSAISGKKVGRKVDDV